MLQECSFFYINFNIFSIIIDTKFKYLLFNFKMSSQQSYLSAFQHFLKTQECVNHEDAGADSAPASGPSSQFQTNSSKYII